MPLRNHKPASTNMWMRKNLAQLFVMNQTVMIKFRLSGSSDKQDV